jgi:ABC-type transporter Mla MlaB component
MEYYRTKPGEYYVSFRRKHFDKHAVEEMYNNEELQSHATVLILDLENIEEITGDAYNHLSSFMKYAEGTEKQVLFTNVPDKVRELVDNLRIVSEG